MSAGLLDCVERQTGENPRFSIIWLHGLGADGHDFVPLIPELIRAGDPPLRFVFPHAPMRAVTINGGHVMRAWYDIRGMDLSAREDLEGFVASQAQVEALIEREKQRGVASERIVLAGFSQGGAMALYVGLRHAQTLAGLVVLSAYLAFPGDLPAARHAAQAQLPVFMANGTVDPVVPLVLGQMGAERLRQMGQPLEFRGYPMAHSVSVEEIADLRTWLQARWVMV